MKTKRESGVDSQSASVKNIEVSQNHAGMHPSEQQLGIQIESTALRQIIVYKNCTQIHTSTSLHRLMTILQRTCRLTPAKTQ